MMDEDRHYEEARDRAWEDDRKAWASTLAKTTLPASVQAELTAWMAGGCRPSRWLQYVIGDQLGGAALAAPFELRPHLADVAIWFRMTAPYESYGPMALVDWKGTSSRDWRAAQAIASVAPAARPMPSLDIPRRGATSAEVV